MLSFFDYEKISIKILARKDTVSYVSLFAERGIIHVCSFFYDKKRNCFSFRRSNHNGNDSKIEQVIDREDFDEDENYLILRYGKIVEINKILSELETTMPRLYSFVSDAIARCESI